ncbi:FRG domain-containing protein [Priestia megaterium]|uniref:FRG domain-containing protein n=1 Tax=Priestia megaterium TaxID=1404 RepID=UPI001C483AA9|nr:FRG domain-containing protein [Priestia megaterium]MBV6738296.1 FRG domain-containing protein [Priestia megaterium]
MELTLTKEDVKDFGSAISAYISKIHKLKPQQKDKELRILVYRGEAKDFRGTACRPNIFRSFDLEEDKNVEINILNSMLSKKYSVGNSYFETAIEAQHGGFPSRLLDVTYNALVALFFAVTPHYTKEETIHDKDSGVVYLFDIPKMSSPASSDVRELYENLLKDNSPLRTENLFSNTYKLLDHSSQNDRIIAQQGAFILFYGNKEFSLPKRIQSKLIICPTLKKEIREELSSMFNINMGTMYPEMMNNVDNILNKIKNLNALSFSYVNEIQFLISELKAECEYRLIEFKANTCATHIDKIKSFEAIFDPINTFKNYLELAMKNKQFKNKINQEELEILIDEHNQYVRRLHNYLNGRFKIEAPSVDNLTINLEESTNTVKINRLIL